MGANMLKTWMLSIVATAAFVSFARIAQSQPPKDHSKARLISEFAKVKPGVTAWFGLDFEIDSGWHLYWDGVNDSGFAPKLNATVTSGFKIGEVVWPAPHRLISPGNILDHVYEKHVTLLFPIDVPKDAAPGVELAIHASPEWLVCHDVCLPGSADLTIKVLVADGGEKPAPTPEAPLFAVARQRIPKPIAKESPLVGISANKDHVTVSVKDAGELAFYPKTDCVSLPNLIKEGQKKGDRLVLTFEAQPGKPPVLRGTVEVKPLDSGPPTLWTVEFDLSGANKHVPESSDQKAPVRGD